MPPLPSIESLPVAAEQRLDARAAGDRVVPVAAVDRRRDAVGEGAVALVDAHGVVAGSGSTAIFAILLRSKLKSAEPSSPTSTWRMPGSPACRRSVILSLRFVPLTVSTPCLSFGALNLAALGGYGL